MKNTTLKFVLGLAALTVGCGGSGSELPPVDAGQNVYSSSVTKLVAEDSGGGFVPQPPPGSTCLVGAKKFTLAVASRGLDWVVCVGDGRNPYHENTGSRVLSEAEYQSLVPYFDKLQVVKSGQGCITDASTLWLTVTTPSGTQQYVDDGSQCQHADKPYIGRDALFPLIDQFNKLASAAI